MKPGSQAATRCESVRIPRGAALALLALAGFAPRAAEACAVCISARDDGTQLGFLLGTLIMTPLPFIVVGSIVFFLWRRARNLPPDVIRSTSSQS